MPSIPAATNYGPTSAATTSQYIWTVWTNASVTNSAATTGNPWLVWNMTYNATITAAELATFSSQQARQASPEQVRAELARREENRQRSLAIEAERCAAKDRAELLLQESLTPAQKEELRANGYFTLRSIGRNGEVRTYRIHRGRSANVALVDAAGKELQRLCAHPVANVPDADTMLAQKLMLEAVPEDFLRMANVHAPRRAA